MLTLACTLAAAPPAQWRADPPHSSATFTVVHLGISHVSGVIPMQAVLDIPDGTHIPVAAQATFDPSAIDTRNADRDADLRSPHFFEVAKYPKMSFASTKIVATDGTHFTVTGDLTMHGQTHPVTLQGTFLGAMTDGRGHAHAAYSAKTTLDRSQWGMTWGNPFAGNSVDVDIEIEAIKS